MRFLGFSMNADYYKEIYPLRANLNRMLRIYRAIGRILKELEATDP